MRRCFKENPSTPQLIRSLHFPLIRVQPQIIIKSDDCHCFKAQITTLSELSKKLCEIIPGERVKTFKLV